MNSKLSIIIAGCLVILVAVLACNKDVNEKKLYIRGRLFVSDNFILNRPDFALANKKVLLANSNSDSLNYIFSDSTDAEGYFIFNLLDNGVNNYKVRFTDTINGYRYYGVADAARGDDKVVLTAHIDSAAISGVTIRSADSLMGAIGGAQVAVYPSSVMAGIGDTSGAVFTGIADGYGNVTTYKIKPGIYFVNSLKKADTLVYARIGKRVEVLAGRRTFDSLVLKRIK